MAGLDPSISLNTKPTMPGPAADPLSTIGQYMDIQNKANQAKLFQQQFMAKQLMGEIIAQTPSKADGSPDWDGIQKGFLSNELTAPFAPQAMNEIRQLHLTNTQIAGQEQDQNMKGASALVKVGLAGYNDIKDLDPAMKIYLDSMPADIRKRMEPVANQFKTYLTANLPDDPAAAQKVVQERIVRTQLASGVTPDVLSGLTGKNVDIDTGGRHVLGVQKPPQEGGGLMPSSVLDKSLAPQAVDVSDPTTGRPSKVIIGGGGPQGTAGAPSMAGPIPGTQGASPADLEMNKQGASYNEKITGDADSGTKILRLMKFARDAEKNFTPGGGAEMKAKIAQLGQAFGLSQANVDKIANGSLAGQQEFKNNLDSIVFSLARQYIPQGSRFAVSEYEGLKDAKPGSNWDPRAVDSVFSEWTKLANQTLTEQSEWNKHLDQGGTYRQWPEKWNKMQQSKGYIDTDPALRVGNSQDYPDRGSLAKAVQSGSLTKDAALKLIKANPKQYGF